MANDTAGANRNSRRARFAALAAVLLAILLVDADRTHLGTRAEADFAGNFGPEAQRILAGEPLQLTFHPAGYPMAAAGAYRLTGDWLRAGLWISGIAALVFLLAGMAAFRRLGGEAAAWGALVATACSTVWLLSASSASSDMLFAAIVALTLATMVRALTEPAASTAWFWVGLCAACAFLTRSNGIAAAAAVAAPFLLPDGHGSRLRGFALASAGFALPILAWVAYAEATGSQLTPSGNHLNLAVAVYGDADLSWSEQAGQFGRQFESLTDVLTHDPPRLVKRVATRMVQLPLLLAKKLTWPPVALLAFLGLAWLLGRHCSRALLAYLAVAGGIAVLSAVVPFQARYHLLLLPLIGAMAAIGFMALLERFVPAVRGRVAATVVAGLALAVVAWRAWAAVLPELETAVQREFDEALPAVERLTTPGATLYARSATLAFEGNRQQGRLADVGDLDGFLRKLCSQAAPTEGRYLYLGSHERRILPGLYRQVAHPSPPAWLEPVATGTRTHWALYRIADPPCAEVTGP